MQLIVYLKVSAKSYVVFGVKMKGGLGGDEAATFILWILVLYPLFYGAAVT